MFFTNVINGIESYFEKSDYSIFLCITEHDKDKEISRINELISRNVAGIIVVDPGIDNVESKYFDKILRDEVGKKFSIVLEHAGVFKRDEEGIKAFNKFINSL